MCLATKIPCTSSIVTFNLCVCIRICEKIYQKILSRDSTFWLIVKVIAMT